MERGNSKTLLSDLPNEIIFQILTFLSPVSTPILQQVSHRFNELSQPLLWRYYCQTQFKYWSNHHQIHQRFTENVTKCDWKKVFSERHSIDRHTTLELNSILRSQTNRIEKSESIIRYGYDTKDSLVRHLRVDDDAEDVLARRYYSDTVLGCLHRRMAIEAWLAFRNGHGLDLEKALAAFDMFVLHDKRGDFIEISKDLDGLALRIRADVPDFDDMSERKKATIIAAHMRMHNLTGVRSDDRYRDLQNNFIGIALQDEDHPSLPLISVAIYCCVAQRLGLDAQPCAFPFHVYAVVTPSGDRDLDGNFISAREKGLAPPPMYMDPFRTGVEVPVSDLQSQLIAMGVSEIDHALLLCKAPKDELVRRTARNIVASVQMIPRSPSNRLLPEMDNAFYAALWVQLLLTDGTSVTVDASQAQYLTHLLGQMENNFPMDVGLIEEYVLPFIQSSDEAAELRDMMAAMRSADTMPITIKRRTPETAKSVQYRIGQVFQHKRYHYFAMITGWDAKCEADEDWMSHMGVHQLSRGRHQSFYHALVDDKSVRYVAEENIEIVTSQFPSSLMALAGQYFKRWDELSNKFVSNIKDEYPDD